VLFLCLWLEGSKCVGGSLAIGSGSGEIKCGFGGLPGAGWWSEESTGACCTAEYLLRDLCWSGCKPWISSLLSSLDAENKMKGSKVLSG